MVNRKHKMTRISPNISFRRTKQLHPRNTEKEMNK